mmetsp:Transcript_22006/g.10350  ORF Transcript_22006/g.10350 Transcript_22006/m.10350 type:complete len:88 (+) Transcript_22006:4724-4987(+)|eukprot:CAMPEP_0201285616 /NCGR_PEP_ID=MMETSP1317-20130820/113581_1 /ASSEMBLY_ACC=CAM_ASM_000770 /TAXON_ID=187299 /ORGANISM="Undescribed Undescribed, Strain Undescribed" /LENGTH=87 /DNA_ID=CAMNT_0047611251 /DNA_START=2917 /DNA_END=3180 /DNA_ORIENTATION=+
MYNKSNAAAFILKWVVNIVNYNKIYRKVKPLMDNLQECEQNVVIYEAELAEVRKRLKEVTDVVNSLNANLEKAKSELERVESEANAC